jgi:hypothetical protein
MQMRRITAFLVLITLSSLPSVVRAQQGLDAATLEDGVSRGLDSLVEADDQETVLEARRDLQALYSRARQANLTFRMGQLLAEQVPLRLKQLGDDNSDALATLKKLNVAILCRSTQSVSVQPALQAMLGQKNPAVRFLAWSAYSTLWPDILAQSKMQTNVLLDALQRDLGAETNPLILEQIFEVAGFRAPEGLPVPEDTQAMARQKAMAGFAANWESWRKRVEAGDEAFLTPAREAAKATIGLYAEAKKTGKTQTRLLQMIIDMMWSAADGWARARQDQKQRLAQGQALLLIDLEEALMQTVAGQVAGNDKLPVIAPMFAAGGADGVGLKLEVLNWGRRLKEFGVQEPKLVTPPAQP